MPLKIHHQVSVSPSTQLPTVCTEAEASRLAPMRKLPAINFEAIFRAYGVNNHYPLVKQKMYTKIPNKINAFLNFELFKLVRGLIPVLWNLLSSEETPLFIPT